MKWRLRPPAFRLTPMQRAGVFIALSLVVGACSLWSGWAEAHSQAHAVLVAEQHEQAEQRAAGAILEAKLCKSFTALAANKPPAGNPAKNPSRAFDQRQHEILDGLGTDLGCKLD